MILKYVRTIAFYAPVDSVYHDVGSVMVLRTVQINPMNMFVHMQTILAKI
jgi:hypothetical protein